MGVDPRNLKRYSNLVKALPPEMRDVALKLLCKDVPWGMVEIWSRVVYRVIKKAPKG
jgi:hypothetical protein